MKTISPTRLLSLDVFRGLTVAAMVLVTNPGTYSAVYPPLLHAQWTGATFTDMIFPSFLVITGVAIPLAFAARLSCGTDQRRLLVHVLRRTALIFLIGLLLNGFPFYKLHTLRLPGVLQRIALCYLFGSLLYFAAQHLSPGSTASSRNRRSVLITACTLALLSLYWILLKIVSVPGFGPGRLDSNGNLGAYLDRRLFGIPHLWPYGITPGIGVTFDPEGLLSTLPALATLLIGILAGEWIRSDQPAAKKALRLALAGIGLLISGLALSAFMPIIKKIWTPTFTLLSGGFALFAFACCYFLIDVQGWRKWTTPARVFGTNAILAFALSNILITLFTVIHVADPSGPENLHAWGYHQLFATWLSPVHASLAYAVSIVLLNLALLHQLYRKQIFLRF